MTKIDSSLFFNVWCDDTQYTQAKPWKIQQLVAQDMRTAIKLFVQNYDKKHNIIFAKNQQYKDAIIYVRDWRGIIAKFNIKVEMQPVYIIKRIK